MEDIDGRGHSVLTPEGQLQSGRAFVLTHAVEVWRDDVGRLQQ